MVPDLTKRIIADLQKTGFPSEFEVRRIIGTHGARWDSTGTMNFFDLDESKLRQVDVYAYMPCGDRVSRTGHTHTVWSLVIEVKKSRGNPWVVFKERRDVVRDVFLWRKGLVSYRHLPAEWESNFSWLIYENSFCKGAQWIGSGIHEAFKEPSDFSKPHGAMLSVIKAAEHFYKLSETMMGDSPKVSEDIGTNTPNVFFTRPVLVFDGVLLSAEMNPAGELIVEEIDMAPMYVGYKSAKYDREVYRVDLVRLNAFEHYLATAEAQHDAIRKAILYHGGLEDLSEQEIIDGARPRKPTE